MYMVAVLFIFYIQGVLKLNKQFWRQKDNYIIMNYDVITGSLQFYTKYCWYCCCKMICCVVTAIIILDQPSLYYRKCNIYYTFSENPTVVWLVCESYVENCRKISKTRVLSSLVRIWTITVQFNLLHFQVTMISCTIIFLKIYFNI